LRHARIHNQLASDPRYAGGIGWCAFDYNTHSNFGAGDRICYHGVTDIWRLPKPAAGFYRSQCDPDEEVVLEPAFHWARGDESVGFTRALVCSNCEHLKFYVGDKLVAEADPDRTEFAHLKYAPFSVDMSHVRAGWGDLRIEGYIAGKQAIARSFSGRGADQKFTAKPDDTALLADGADTTRIVLRVTDEFGAVRPFASDAIRFELTGPAELIGDNPFALVGGAGAIWIRAAETAGKARLTAHHPYLGAQTVEIDITPAPPELA
jgi:beta-galactosidase